MELSGAATERVLVWREEVSTRDGLGRVDASMGETCASQSHEDAAVPALYWEF
jgi:hypothetical protein